MRPKGIGNKPPKFRDSENPLIHVMYLLRHVNVHARISKTQSEKTPIVWCGKDRDKEFEMDVIILEKPTIQEISHSSEAKNYYKVEQLNKASEWLDSNQKILGITHIFFKGLSAYCRELKKSFKTTHLNKSIIFLALYPFLIGSKNS